jgi:single-strand DNA-binding protein
MSSFTINRVVLIGRLTKDPELRTLPSGLGVCSLRIACNSQRRDNDGEYRDKPNYFDVSVFGAVAESVSRYTHKGSRVAIDGRLEWREWETSDQQKRQAVSVVADTVLFLDGPGERAESGQRDGEPSNDFGSEPESAGESYDDSPDELVGVGAGAGGGDDDLVF